MNQIVLRSSGNEPLEPLITSALELEKKEILTAIMKTKNKLSIFEKRYKINTVQFLKHSESIDEMESIEWEGEYETLNRLQSRLEHIEEIQICS